MISLMASFMNHILNYGLDKLSSILLYNQGRAHVRGVINEHSRLCVNQPTKVWFNSQFFFVGEGQKVDI